MNWGGRSVMASAGGGDTATANTDSTPAIRNNTRSPLRLPRQRAIAGGPLRSRYATLSSFIYLV